MRRSFVSIVLAAFVAAPALAAPPATDPPADPPGDAKPAETPPEKVEPKADEAKPDPKDEPAADPEEEEDVFGDDEDDEDSGWEDDTPEPTFPRLEHHGYLRFRADMFGNGHLGTAFRGQNSTTTFGTSAVRPPLTENWINNEGGPAFGTAVGEAENDETFLASANIRFRYQPTFLISESLKIAATFDILDNLVMGSTPDFHPERPDVPLGAFSGGQAPPSSSFQFQDSIRVKELYGEWKILGAIPLRFGRMKSQWGLGVLANAGDGWDDDYGDYNDRILLALQFYGIYFFGGYDIVASGPTFKQDHQPFGQAYDATESDDVTQGFFGIFQKPLSKAELDARAKRLNTDRKIAFDWGVYSVFRRQKLDLDRTSYDSIADGSATFDTTELIERNAFAIIPDIWLRLEYRPKYSQRIRLELEGSLIYAQIENVTYTADSPDREVLSWGVALETEYQIGGLNISLYAGLASGDDAEGLGVNDRSNFQDGDDPKTAKFNTNITNFRFDRNYHIDMLMFRETIGTITNAWYARPAVSYDIFADSPDEALGAEVALVMAGAMEKKAYPGDSAFLGTELDIRLYYEQTNKFLADLAFGLFIPGGAFDLLPGYNSFAGDKRAAEIAWTLQTHLVLQF